jgi:hypothetical protein
VDKRNDLVTKRNATVNKRNARVVVVVGILIQIGYTVWILNTYGRADGLYLVMFSFVAGIIQMIMTIVLLLLIMSNAWAKANKKSTILVVVVGILIQMVFGVWILNTYGRADGLRLVMLSLGAGVVQVIVIIVGCLLFVSDDWDKQD